MPDKYVSKIVTPFGERLIKAVALADSLMTTLTNTFKPKQTAVPSPTASGSGIQFIDTISQDVNGVITVHKRVVTDASQSQKGLMSAADKTKLDNIVGVGIVNCTYDSDNSAWVMDKTYSEILAEFNSGKIIVLAWEANANDDRTILLGRKVTISSKDTFVFVESNFLTDANSKIYPIFYVISINEDGVVSVTNTHVSYDGTLNGTSSNAVQNNVVYNALSNKEDKLSTITGKTEADIVNGVFSISEGNTETRLQLTTIAALQINANAGAPNFAVTIDNSLNSSDVTLSVKDSTGTNDLLYSVAAGNSIESGKLYQITCVGNCWTLAEFAAPTP